MVDKRPSSWTWTNYSWLSFFVSAAVLVVGGLVSAPGKPDDGPPGFIFLLLMSLVIYAICRLMAVTWVIVDFVGQRPKSGWYAMCPAAVIIALALLICPPPALTWMGFGTQP